jgi:hypothetical protein
MTDYYIVHITTTFLHRFLYCLFTSVCLHCELDILHLEIRTSFMMHLIFIVKVCVVLSDWFYFCVIVVLYARIFSVFEYLVFVSSNELQHYQKFINVSDIVNIISISMVIQSDIYRMVLDFIGLYS